VTNFLRLAALDVEDLKILSAYVQDAVVQAGDIEFLAKEQRVILVMNRFVWEKPQGFLRKSYERRRAVLHFDRVRSAARSGFDGSRPEQVLSLLAITFTPTETPAGTIELHFSGGAGLRLGVECIEAQLTDLGSAWETRQKPVHRV
jgi:hypothetical protein